MSDPDRTVSEGYLRIVNVTKTFGELVAVNDFSLDIQEGEFVCLLGPSGCGKTTLLRIIAGLEEQNAGELSQGGRISRACHRTNAILVLYFNHMLYFPI